MGCCHVQFEQSMPKVERISISLHHPCCHSVEKHDCTAHAQNMFQTENSGKWKTDLTKMMLEFAGFRMARVAKIT